jgi:hypothetical protein
MTQMLARAQRVTKTKQSELYRYWTQRDRAANLRLFRLAAEILHAIEALCSCRTPAGSAGTASSGVAVGPGSEMRLSDYAAGCGTGSGAGAGLPATVK